MKNPVLLDPTKHQHLKITDQADFSVTANEQFVPLTVEEFAQAASSFPVMLLKDGQSGQFRSVAFLGLEANQNLYWQADTGVWEGVYVPQRIVREPFSLGPAPGDEKTLTLYIDENSKKVSEKEGLALFDNDEPTAFLQGVQNKLSEYFNNEMVTKDFVQQLLAHELLREMELLIRFATDRTKRVKGLYTIDEEKLRALDEQTVLQFHKQNYFMPIHSMLSSITQFNRMLRLNNGNSQYEAISNLQMRAVEETQ